MTKRQRAQVVELLRCAASHATGGLFVEGSISTAGDFIGVELAVERYARLAEQAVCSSRGHEWKTYDGDRYERLLEAAARVEEGSWPP